MPWPIRNPWRSSRGSVCRGSARRRHGLLPRSSLLYKARYNFRGKNRWQKRHSWAHCSFRGAEFSASLPPQSNCPPALQNLQIQAIFPPRRGGAASFCLYPSFQCLEMALRFRFSLIFPPSSSIPDRFTVSLMMAYKMQIEDSQQKNISFSLHDKPFGPEIV